MASEDKVYESIRILIEGESSRSKNFKESNVTICMVPDSLRKLNTQAYTPRVVSIGPLHKEDEHLRGMEEHKVTYVYRLFYRTKQCLNWDMERVTRKCVQAIHGVVSRARACYAPSFTNYDDSRFAEMMVIDGCFILELLFKFNYGVAEGDPIFDNILVTHDIKNDLLLLENQIPFFVLEILFRLTVKLILQKYSETISRGLTFNDSLSDFVFCFFKDMNIINNSELTLTDKTAEHCHILGLFQSCYKPRGAKRGRIPTISYSATEIAGAGVGFKAQHDQESLLAVTFKRSPFVPGLVNLCVRKTCFKIPVLSIKNSTPSLLKNLIAYEQCYPLSRHYITSFAFLMDRLIDTKDDVALLVRSKVLQHNLGASEDVTNLFNSICNGVVLRDFYYTEEWRKLDAYCNQFWPSILISVRRLYKSTTWKTLTVIAAMIIFATALVQTIYTVRNA